MFIEHVNLTVTNLQRSLDFYHKLFGWTTRWRGQTATGRPAAHVGDEHCYIALFEGETTGRAGIDYDAVGFNHVGVVVESLDEMQRRLAALGVEHSEEPDYEPGRRVYFTDPDGIEVELVQYELAAT